MAEFPVVRQTVLDTTDARALAEFYRKLFGLEYRPGDEPPRPGEPDPLGQDWLVLRTPDGSPLLAFAQVSELRRTTWPAGEVPQQMHLDTTVPTAADLDAQHARVLALGGELRYDRSADPEEPLRVYADPAGHLFCIFVSAGGALQPGRGLRRPWRPGEGAPRRRQAGEWRRALAGRARRRARWRSRGRRGRRRRHVGGAR